MKILVAAHKPYWMPAEQMYLPVQAGAAAKEGIPGFRRDDEGENISSKNPRYSELTVLYWGWKNLDEDYLGLAHYRRHFAGAGEHGVLTSGELGGLLERASVVLPKKRHYVVETIGAHYGHTFDPVHVQVVRMALESVSPEYVPAFDAHMQERSSHMWNMLVARRDVLDAYCSWLFSVLELVDAGIDYEGMSEFEARAVGRLAERLLDVWIVHNGIEYVEVPIASLERTDWLKKGGSFLAAKFLGKKYGESF